MTGLQFSELSYDLKSMIIGYVTRPSDLKRLCLVNKEWRDVAARKLYRRVELDIGCEADLKLSAFLGRENPGLEHIRTLVLNPEPDSFLTPPRQRSPSPTPPGPPPPNNLPVIIQGPQVGGFGGPPPPHMPPPPPGAFNLPRRPRTEERKPRYVPAHFTTRLLLDLLPRNIIEKFRWTSYDEYSVENYLLLLKKQKMLKCIEVGPTDKSLLEALEKSPEVMNGLDQLHALDLYPDSLECLKACRLIMKNTPRLDELWIESACEASSNGDDQNFEDDSGRPGLITTTLFEDKVPFQTCTSPMTLRYLALSKLNLRWAAQTYMRVIDFPNLEEIEVRGCVGSDALFAEMTKPAKMPTKLKELTFSQTIDSHNYAMSALEGFLMATGTLKKIIITITGEVLPKIASLCKQGDNLTNLLVHAMPSMQGLFDTTRIVYPSEDVEKLAKECPNIQQLGIACPQSYLLDVTCTEDYVKFTEAIMSFPNLITLNYTAWPDVSQVYDPRITNGKLPVEIYWHNIQSMAQATFKRHISYSKTHQPTRGSTLRIIAFGANVKNFHLNTVQGIMNQLVFSIGKRFDAFGNQSLLAVRVKAPAVKFVEPYSEILDYVFPENSHSIT